MCEKGFSNGIVNIGTIKIISSKQNLNLVKKTVDKLQRIWYYIYRVKNELNKKKRGN